MSRPKPGRLVDLHVDWLLQYAPETGLYGPGMAARVPGRLGQAEGYLQATSAAVVACYRDAEDWSRRDDPWAALGTLIARVEAEFSGRILIGPDDLARWGEDRDGLCWAMIGVEGFDFLVRTADDLGRLRGLFDRGVRVFQPTYGASGMLAGSSAAGDDRGLLDLGRLFLDALADLAPPAGVAGPRPIVDLAHLNPASASGVLDWFEADAGRRHGLLAAYSHGAPRHEGFDSPRALATENLARLRALGGTVGLSVGPPFFDSAEALFGAIEAVSAIPFEGRIGFEGIAIGTDFLGVDAAAPGLGDAGSVVSWLAGRLDAPTAAMLVRGNAGRLMARAAGGP